MSFNTAPTAEHALDKPKPSPGLFRKVGIFSLMTFLSRILGFIRDMVFANVFGAGLDTFLVAWRIPNLFRRMFAEGAFSQAFVPLMSEYQSTRTDSEIKAFVQKVTGNLAMVLLLVTLFGIICAPWLIQLYSPGFGVDPDRFALSTQLLRLTFPYLFFIGLAALVAGILNTYGIFGPSSFSPVLLNVALIGAAIYFVPFFEQPLVALAIGVCVGGVLQLGFQWPFLVKTKLLTCPTIDWRDAGVKKLLALMVPALLGASVHQINLLFDTIFASFLAQGSISWLYYADRLMEFPLGIVGVGVATVMLPALSFAFSSKKESEYERQFIWGIKIVCLLGVPAAVSLGCLSGPLIVTLFYSGAFLPEDVLMSHQSLLAYAPGVLGLMLVKLLTSSFYARQDIKTPVKIAFVAMALNIVFNLSFIPLFGHVGIALSTSLTSFVQAMILLVILKKRIHLTLSAGAVKLGFQIVFATLLMAGLLQVMNSPLHEWLTQTRWIQIKSLTVLVLLGLVVYPASLWLTGFRLHHLRA